MTTCKVGKMINLLLKSEFEWGWWTYRLLFSRRFFRCTPGNRCCRCFLLGTFVTVAYFIKLGVCVLVLLFNLQIGICFVFLQRKTKTVTLLSFFVITRNYFRFTSGSLRYSSIRLTASFSGLFFIVLTYASRCSTYGFRLLSSIQLLQIWREFLFVCCVRIYLLQFQHAMFLLILWSKEENPLASLSFGFWRTFR